MITVDHVATALAKLPSNLRDNASWIATVSALVRPLQPLETVLQAMLVQRRLPTATGVHLTTIGKWVGQERNGVTDDELFRRYVRTRISANRSRGTIEDLIKISNLLINDDTATHVLLNWGIASLVLRVDGVAVSDALHDVLIGFLRDAAAAGVRVILQTSEDVPANMFAWDDADAGAGWSEQAFIMATTCTFDIADDTPQSATVTVPAGQYTIAEMETLIDGQLLAGWEPFSLAGDVATIGRYGPPNFDVTWNGGDEIRDALGYSSDISNKDEPFASPGITTTDIGGLWDHATD